METAFATLKTKLAEVSNLYGAASVLSWDQRVNMPPGGAKARAEQLATLGKLTHELFTRDEIGTLLEDTSNLAYPFESDEASLIRVARRDYALARKLPTDLIVEMTRTFSLGEEIWAKAREAKDFNQFADVLTKIVDLNIQKAEALGYEDKLYDALLDEYEPGMHTTEVKQVFDTLKASLVPLVQAIAERSDAVDDSFLKQDFDETAQWDFGLLALKDVGFDLNRGRQDKSVHPFSISFSTNDVRITTRVFRDMFPSSLFSTLHEAGHAMYEQNVAPSLDGSLLASGTSLGVHESQSRMWENVVGRSRDFWQYYYPRLQEYFPMQLGMVSLEQFYQAINKVEPSFIRVEADELTYNMHIFLRFELEQDLVEQRLAIKDLPAAWNAKMQEYLGLIPPDDSLGVLQDVHWSGGAIGYFPTYTLGNVLSLQFYERALQDIPTLPEHYAQGAYLPLLNWFREHIHQHGRKFTAKQLLERVTGSPAIKAEPYLNYVQRKYADIYGL